MEHQIIRGARWLTMVYAVVLCSVLVSCYYDNEDELYPNGCNTNDISYNDNIVQILQSNCLSCHDALSQNGNVNLEGYDNVKLYIDNGRLIGAIRHEDGYSTMPQGTSKLSKCTIDRIQAWVDAGAPNN